MQSTSATYKALLLDQFHQVEYRLDVYTQNGATLVHTFNKTEIEGMYTVAGLFNDSKPSIGGTTSAEIDAKIRISDVVIPRMAMLRPYVRLTGYINDEYTESEWLPKGVFWIDTRETDYATQVLHIHGYDAMLKAEQTFFNFNPLPINFQMFDYHILDGYSFLGTSYGGILRKMGVELEADTRLTIITNGEKFTFPMPNDVQLTSGGRLELVDGADWNCRDLLSNIAAAYCGNFCFDENGKLKLVKFQAKTSTAGLLATEDYKEIVFGGTVEDGEIIGGKSIIVTLGDSAYVGNAVRRLDNTPEFEPFTSVTIYTGEGDDHYTWPFPVPAGRNLRVDTSARTPTIINGIAKSILGKLNGYVYRPFSAVDAIVDPAVQLGDIVNIGGVEYIVNNITTNYDALCAADISSPEGNDIDHEYPFMSNNQRRTMKEYISLNNRVNNIEALINPLKAIIDRITNGGNS